MNLSRRNGTGVPGEAVPAGGGRERQKERTRATLLAAAARLLAAGQSPSVADVADAATVSRRTAYRYFATQEQLLVEAALEGLHPGIVRDINGDIEGGDAGDSDGGPDDDPAGLSQDDIEKRLDRTVRTVQRNAMQNEALLRTMIRLTVGRVDALEEDGAPAPSPRRRGYRRIERIELALAPARKRLGKRRYKRLVASLTVCMGIDALIVLKDLCGLSDEKAEDVSRWAARALLRASLDR